MVTKGERSVGGVNEEFEISKYKLLYIYIKYINNEVLLYSTGNYIQFSIVNHNGKEYKNEYICV